MSLLQYTVRQCLLSLPSWVDDLVQKEEYELKKKWLDKAGVTLNDDNMLGVEKEMKEREKFWSHEERQDLDERLQEVIQGLKLE